MSESALSCSDCSVNVIGSEYSYIVLDPIWAAATKQKEADLLCIGCMEERLGRRLTRDDFDWSIPLTDMWMLPRSDRLLDRMGKGKLCSYTKSCSQP